MRAWRAGGLDALRPSPRSDTGAVRAHPELVAEAAALRLELPTRSAAQIASILFHRHGVPGRGAHGAGPAAPGGAAPRGAEAEPKVFGRYEATRPNERWISDVLVGPWVPWPRVDGVGAGQAVPDRRRPHPAVGRRPVLRRGEHPGRPGRAAPGDRPPRAARVLYVDNGAPFANAWLARTCAVLGIRLVHSKPYSPQGRGKQERLNRYIREAFLAEADPRRASSRFDELNDLFMAWAEQVANRRIHAETSQTPIERFERRRPATAPPTPTGWPRRSAGRSPARVTRTATVPLAATATRVDPALVGRRVELRYDPEDLTRIDVYLDGKPAGVATPFVIGRHIHRAVPQAARPARRADRDRLPRPGRRRPRRGRRHRHQDRLRPARPCSTTRRPEEQPDERAAPWAAHFGLTRTPFGKADRRQGPLRPPAHAEAVARINFCVVEVRPRGDHRRRRRRQDRVGARRRRRPGPRPATRSSTSPTPPSAPAASTSPSSRPSAPSPATTRPS